MEKSQMSSSPVFSVVVSGQSASAEGNYPLINEIRSTDNTVSVSPSDGVGPIELSVSVIADGSVSSLLTFEVKQANPGIHTLKSKASVAGIILIDTAGKIQILDNPGENRILVFQNGSCSWYPIPAQGKKVFGVSDGDLSWYDIDVCNVCDEDQR